MFREFIRYLKRFPSTTILILIGFTISFLSLFNGLSLSKSIVDDINKENEFSYQNQVNVSISLQNNKISINELLKFTKDLNCNVVLNGLEVYLNNGESGTIIPNVIVRSNEKLNYPIRNLNKILDENSIVIADNFKDEIKNNYIKINDKQFKVGGLINTVEYPFYRSLIVMSIDNVFELTDQGLQEINLEFLSNKTQVYSDYEKFKIKVKEEFPSSIIIGREIDRNINVFKSILDSQSILYFGLFLFALINLIIVSEYWIIRRKREISIRKAFGISNKEILKMLAKEMSLIILYSIILSIVLEFFVANILKLIHPFSISVLLICGIILSFVIIIIISLIVPTYYVINIIPAEGVKEL